MTEFISFSRDDNYFDGEWLYLKDCVDDFYRFELIPYKNMVPKAGVYLMIYQDEEMRQFFAFYDKQVSDFCYNLFSTGALGPKSIRNLLKTISVAEFQTLVAHKDYATLAQVKGISVVTSKILLDDPVWIKVFGPEKE